MFWERPVGRVMFQNNCASIAGLLINPITPDCLWSLGSKTRYLDSGTACMSGSKKPASKKPADPVAAQPQQTLLKRGNETTLTYRLKWSAWEWLHTVAKCRSIAFEVRLEGPLGRIADVVGIGPENRVYLIEVKSSRSDKARDDNTTDDYRRLAAREPIAEESVRLTAGILEAAAGYARAPTGGNTPAKRDTNDWREDAGYRQALRDHAATVRQKERLRGQIATFSTKFHDAAYLRCAHFHYVMAPAGLIHTTEVPPMWGLLDEHLNARVEAPYKQVPEATRHVLRAISRANSRDLMNAYGVQRSKEGLRFPGWD